MSEKATPFGRYGRYIVPQPCSAPAADVDRSRLHAFTTPAHEDLTSDFKYEPCAANTRVVGLLADTTQWAHRLTHFGTMAFFCALVYVLVYAKAVFSQVDERASAPSRYLFVFGDSYSATGYNMTLQPQPSLTNPLGNPGYPGARTAGGDIWIDIVVKNLSQTVVYDLAVGANCVNYTQDQANSLAAGGPIKDFRDQQAEFAILAKNKSIQWTAQNSAFISMFGINDVAVQIYQGRTFSESTAILTPTVSQYFALLARQYQLGARNFITVLVPPIYRAPVWGYGTAGNAPDVHKLTTWWNNLITQQNAKFKSGHSSAKSLIVDPSPIFNNVLDNPGQYGAPNSTCLSYPQGQPCLWADFIHPGIVMQRELGYRMVMAVRDSK